MERLKKLNNILEEVGLSKREKQVYLCLLEFKGTRLAEIINKTNLGKSTVHQVLNNLVKMRLVYTNNKKYDKNYSLYPPKKLLSLVANKRRRARRLELEIEGLLPQLNSLYNLSSTQPKVEIYTNIEGYILLAEQSLEVKIKVVYYLGDLDNWLSVTGGKFDESYIPDRKKKGIAFKLLTLDTPLMREYKKKDKLENRETRFLSKDMKIEDTILIFDNTVTFFSSPEEKLALSITSPSIAETQLTIFNKLWEMSE